MLYLYYVYFDTNSHSSVTVNRVLDYSLTFLFRNKIFETSSGVVLARSLLMTRPAVLNKRSDGTLVAGMASYLNARADSSGYSVLAKRQKSIGDPPVGCILAAA